MKSSLGVLKDALGRKVAILGDMGELGPQENELHREVGTYAGTLDIDRFLLAGALCKNLADGILEQNPQADVIWYENLFALLRDLEKQVRDGDTVLVKASHFMHFEKIVDALAAEAE